MDDEEKDNPSVGPSDVHIETDHPVKLPKISIYPSNPPSCYGDFERSQEREEPNHCNCSKINFKVTICLFLVILAIVLCTYYTFKPTDDIDATPVPTKAR